MRLLDQKVTVTVTVETGGAVTDPLTGEVLSGLTTTVYSPEVVWVESPQGMGYFTAGPSRKPAGYVSQADVLAVYQGSLDWKTLEKPSTVVEKDGISFGIVAVGPAIGGRQAISLKRREMGA